MRASHLGRLLGVEPSRSGLGDGTIGTAAHTSIGESCAHLVRVDLQELVFVKGCSLLSHNPLWTFTGSTFQNVFFVFYFARTALYRLLGLDLQSSCGLCVLKLVQLWQGEPSADLRWVDLKQLVANELFWFCAFQLVSEPWALTQNGPR